MNGIKKLEHAALAAHRRGDCWVTFWNRHADAIRAAEPVSVGQYHRLVARLLHLVCSGDPSGQEPAGEPWLLDDDVPAYPVVSDTITRARLLADAMPGVFRGCDCPSPCEVCRCQ